MTLDIIIPVHDRVDWLKVCVESIKSFTENEFRIIIINNASRLRATQDYLESLVNPEFDACDHRIEVIHLDKNKSFSNAVNVGAEAGTAPFIFIVNSDIVVQPRWDTTMIQELSDPKVGLVGAQSNNVSPPQCFPAGLVPNPGALNFTCVGLRRKVWDEVGPMDEETFDGFSSEDVDYSIRVVDKGYKLKVSDAWVFHGGSQTLAVTVGGEASQTANNAKYLERLQKKHGKKRYDAVVKSSALPVVAVASMSSEEWTRVAFMEALVGLRVMGPYQIRYMHTRRQMPNVGRQAIVDTARRNGYDYVLMIDDDQVPAPDLLQRLMKHGKDVTGVVVYQRVAPYMPCVFDVPGEWTVEKAEKGEYRHDMLIKSGAVAPKVGCERQGLIKVDSIGFGAILLKLSIFDKIDAYIESEKDPRFVEKGRYFGNFSGIGEDLFFCTLARAAGVEIHCDTDIILPHIGDSIVIDEAYKKAWEREQRASTASKLD